MIIYVMKKMCAADIIRALQPPPGKWGPYHWEGGAEPGAQHHIYIYIYIIIIIIIIIIYIIYIYIYIYNSPGRRPRGVTELKLQILRSFGSVVTK